MIFTINQLQRLSSAELRAIAGGKGSNLVTLVQHGLPVPPFFIVSARALELAYFKHWGVELAEDIEASRSDLAERIRQSATSHMCSLEISCSELELFTDKACTDFAVRSSARCNSTAPSPLPLRAPSSFPLRSACRSAHSGSRLARPTYAIASLSLLRVTRARSASSSSRYPTLFDSRSCAPHRSDRCRPRSLPHSRAPSPSHHLQRFPFSLPVLACS